MEMRADLSRTVTRDHDREGEDSVEGGAPCLFLVLECDRPLASSSRHALAELDEVVVGRAPMRRWSRCERDGTRLLAVGVPDARMSQVHARLVRDMGRWILEDAGSKNGVILNGERHDRAVLEDGDMFELGHTFFLFRESPGAPAVPFPLDCEAAELAPPAPGLLTFAPSLVRSFGELVQVARAPVSVLVQGETGTGKELLARAVHTMSGGEGEFVAVNCGALPETLVESELFGYVKGAFSGASQDRLGLIRSAERGTLFLDEIGDLSPSSQAALLRVLQEREVTPLGSSRPVRVNIQVVAATHHDLSTLVARDQFRRDLFARIAGFTVRLPLLRQRREDLGLLIASLLPRVAPPEQAGSIRLRVEAARVLFNYDWPLNVRELEGCLSIAAALAGRSLIGLEHLTEAVRGERQASAETTADTAPPLSPEDQEKRDQLMELLRQHRGNISAVARAAGKARVQIHRWLRRYRLDPRSFRR
jgi:sigma-54 dependent transcriptional regulator, acetoin dehydrogenase operon transcriptional activator AcoR